MKSFTRITVGFLVMFMLVAVVAHSATAADPCIVREGETIRLTPRPDAVAGVVETSVDLAGTWRFNGAADIQVPGEWVMQGFDVEPGKAATYERSFTVPKDWEGRLIMLRCDAVFSDATVWVNDREAGKHLGGFTPFELDVTALVKPGAQNVIRLAVVSESVADRLASASKYACHPLGGITRGIRLFVLPAIHLSELHVVTTLDKEYRDACLGLDIGVESETNEVKALLALTAPDGRNVPLSPDRVTPGRVTIPVANPLKWDNEHPNLYRLTVKLEVAGKVVETVTQRVGFRQVEVRGNQMFVNNRPVKLRGSNHHEVYPNTGRSVPPGIHRRDIELFREGNVNLLRTCHYPPDEALMEAADELGMFIECEAPFCWAPGSGNKELVLLESAEMVLTYRNHPSVLFWSLANESKWGENFIESSKLVRELDPTRPQTFNNPGDQKFTEIANLHYPGHGGPAKGRGNVKNPIYLGEDCHLNAYNRLELATDPALRDAWGRYTREMWDDIYDSEGCLGQSIWSGIDDTFYLKGEQTVGYGAWGPLDGWRREKPEYWNMRKAYSPVRLLDSDKIAVTGGVIQVVVENRQNFSDLNEMKIAWKLGKQSGTAAADIPPRGKGVLSIKLDGSPRVGDKLELTIRDPRGFVADRFSLPVQGFAASPPAKTRTGKVNWRINQQTGQLESADKLAITGPQLMLLPLNKAGGTQMTGKTKVWDPFTAPCAGWVCRKVTSEAGTTTVEGAYDGAEGAYTFNVQPGGGIEIAYAFTITKPVDPRQVGLVFTLPRDCEIFSWERRGYWDVYPEDHIARLRGTVKASEGFEATSVGPRTKPSHPWRLDNLPYGNNDFCSTKHNVLRATLTDSTGHGIAIDGNGQQHVRCWRTASAVNVLVADYSNGGSENFLRNLAKADDRPLKPGDRVSGTVRLEFCPVRSP